ncbi:polysaccharide deacetylase family protein [Solirubrobacter ginsenosidimutans]|uniref:polysaccharide deacetylase family protein n=1 Tax=Solirubrobacter ginsenosidimutans TaxID=490573 RepID=UPI0022CE3136|nr:polysaccharide deacetylase family protein [Solirubrobacter ginsenosidimutans]
MLEPGEAHVWLSEQRFLAVLDAVGRRDDVRLSFDDSFRSDVDVALPALLDRGLTATFFVLAGRLDHPEHLGASDLQKLNDSGMTVASHGLHHRNWRNLDEGGLAEELDQARNLLTEATGKRVTQASVPFGAYDRRVLSRLRAAGYDHVYTSDGGQANARQWLQPRTSITVTDSVSAIAKQPASGEAMRIHLKRFVKRWR